VCRQGDAPAAGRCTWPKIPRELARRASRRRTEALIVFLRQPSRHKAFSPVVALRRNTAHRRKTRKTLTPLAEIAGAYHFPVAPLARKHVSTVIWEKGIMSRIAIVNALVDNVGLSKKHANAVLKELFDASEGVIAKALKKGEKVGITGFGTFSVGKRNARVGRNPQTGEKVKIAASKAPKFKAGASLKAYVNGKTAATKAKKAAKKVTKKAGKKAGKKK
jgi:DNA-binding protein HU-beta